MPRRSLALTLASIAAAPVACAAAPEAVFAVIPDPPALHLRGHLLLIGGALEDSNAEVFRSLLELADHASQSHPTRLVILTAASGDQAASATSIVASFTKYCPACTIDTITRQTPTPTAVALIDAAAALFFTGGDQKRITTQYFHAQHTTPEYEAMARLLSRGGVIAGTSAGAAMMSNPMFLGGQTAAALGIDLPKPQAADDDDAAPAPTLGPRIGSGMGFLPWAISDSHFFERNRFGRLVAAMEVSGVRFGLGIGENACAHIDLSTGDITGISDAGSLLIDIGAISRDGLARTHIRARAIQHGQTLSFPALSASPPPPLAQRPPDDKPAPQANPAVDAKLPESRAAKRLESWRFFVAAQDATQTTASHMQLEGYEQRAWPDGRGWSIVEIRPTTVSATPPPSSPSSVP